MIPTLFCEEWPEKENQMKKGEWTFITNHGRVLAYLAKHEKATVQETAHDTMLSIGAVDNIIRDLRNGGYINWRKEGRRNHYKVYGNRPMRHRLERDYQIGDLLAAIGCNGHRVIHPEEDQETKV
jgi:DNA-binding transcriptional ArsR family regulator